MISKKLTILAAIIGIGVPIVYGIESRGNSVPVEEYRAVKNADETRIYRHEGGSCFTYWIDNNHDGYVDEKYILCSFAPPPVSSRTDLDITVDDNHLFRDITERLK